MECPVALCPHISCDTCGSCVQRCHEHLPEEEGHATGGEVQWPDYIILDDTPERVECHRVEEMEEAE